MNELTVEAAATSFPEIIDQLSADGEPIIVTRDGKPVAQISAPDAFQRAFDQTARNQAFQRLAALRSRVTPMSREQLKVAVEGDRR